MDRNRISWERRSRRTVPCSAHWSEPLVVRCRGHSCCSMRAKSATQAVLRHIAQIVAEARPAQFKLTRRLLGASPLQYFVPLYVSAPICCHTLCPAYAADVSRCPPTTLSRESLRHRPSTIFSNVSRIPPTVISSISPQEYPDHER